MKMSYRTSRYLFNVLLVSLCTQALPVQADVEAMNRVLGQQPTLSGFNICHAGGCARISATQIDAQEWQQLKRLCEPQPVDAEAERACIGASLAVFEQIVGAKTGTDQDRGGTFGNSAYTGQMDCNDEAINTTTYLKLMDQHGLLRYHEIADISRRGFFFKGWPHTTAVIRQRQTQQHYAVDAWFYDNGHAPAIVPLETWKSGWKPEDSQAR